MRGALPMSVDNDARGDLSPSQVNELKRVIEGERARTVARIAAFERNFDDIVRSSEGSPPDDEHDPEGATIAFERQQVAALLEQARRRLADADAAVTAWEAGTYGRCETCGRPIGAERLAARPTARTCIDCAR